MGTRLCMRSLGLISTIVLARLLVPEDFGLIAIATAFLAILTGASVLGFNAALIKFQTYSRDDLDTAWTLNVIRGCILCLIVFIASAYLPEVLKEPRLEPILQILAIRPLIKGVRNTALIGFEKELDYSRESFMNIAGKIAATLTTVIIAILLRSYWALIAGMMVGAVAKTIAGYVLYPYLPRPCFKSTRKLFSFSIWLSFSHFVSAISGSFDKMISAVLFSTGITGLYHMGQEISSLLTREIFSPLRRVLYPGFAKFSGNLDKLRANALESASILAGIGLPIGIGFAFTAREFVPIVLGPKWLEIIPMVQVLAPVLGLQTLTNAAHASLLSLGMTKALFVRSICVLAIRLPLLIFGGYYFGFSGLIFAHALSELVSFFIDYLVMGKVLDCRISDLFSVAARSFAAVAIMSVVLLLIHFNFSVSQQDISGLLAAIILKVVLGSATYIAAHYYLWARTGKPPGFEARILALGSAAIEKFTSSRRVNNQ